MRAFQVTYTEKWIETIIGSFSADSHKELAEKQSLKNIRIANDRFREIEKNGKYYRVTELCKGGKSFIFEIVLW